MVAFLQDYPWINKPILERIRGQGTKMAREYVISSTWTINSQQKNQPDPEGNKRKLAPPKMTWCYLEDFESLMKEHIQKEWEPNVSLVKFRQGRFNWQITRDYPSEASRAVNRSQPVATPKLSYRTDQPRPAPERYVPPIVPARKLDGKIELDKTRTNLDIIHTWKEGKRLEGYLLALSYFQ
ncbi:uncharacterized protein EAF02_001438 [Botrytis sinoallii]|uniref:uncharacterized protein n=1 Tax=Botrytis sinoallii TaxID=1463999 RepID=UPI0019003623|nr:uncharacterized protein EAF02_001438 [Botrytis sinoallii]KAF7891113.1 hypothetical protein EAF02_001438 [Botrytis sinoallii]